MDIEHRDDNHWHFSLGPVERWVLSLVGTSLIALVGWTGYNFGARLDDQEKSLMRIEEQQAVGNAQVAALSSQLADVPGIMRQLAADEVRITDNERRVTNLEQVRGHLQ